jgi:hypothetical protein
MFIIKNYDGKFSLVIFYRNDNEINKLKKLLALLIVKLSIKISSMILKRFKT